MDENTVAIRMYRVGELGDCFLLKFKQAGKKSNILIDCGSFRNKDKSVKRMQAIAANIVTELNGESLDVVVGTHQHNDHMSGFAHARETFLNCGAKQGWLSWLDDPNDDDASSIASEQKNFTDTLHKIRGSLEESENTKFTESKLTDRLNDVLGFYLGLAGEPPAVPAAGLATIKDMSEEMRYLRPGQKFDLPGLEPGTVNVYVLGPPKNTELLFDITDGKGESYDPKIKKVNESAKGYLNALTNFSKSDDPDPEEAYFPFDKKFQRDINDKGFKRSPYFFESNEWQQINTDWLDQAERLGLYLDSYTNNTSLVLAFEIVESKQVLLFVGDAQTGNWLSWKDIDWLDNAVGTKLETLLDKTVFYKVGHHCSHNATLVAGLEAMTSPDLVAMIPVDKTDSNITKKNGWKMPASNLYKRLMEKTNLRLLRMDDVYDEDCRPDKNEKAKKAWESIPGKVVVNDLFIEYQIPLKKQ